MNLNVHLVNFYLDHNNYTYFLWIQIRYILILKLVISTYMYIA